jgi:hypothetical protein
VHKKLQWKTDHLIYLVDSAGVYSLQDEIFSEKNISKNFRNNATMSSMELLKLYRYGK